MDALEPTAQALAQWTSERATSPRLVLVSRLMLCPRRPESISELGTADDCGCGWLSISNLLVTNPSLFELIGGLTC